MLDTAFILNVPLCTALIKEVYEQPLSGHLEYHKCWSRYLESIVQYLLLDYTKLKKGNRALYSL
jgi:hypothetical protein